MDREESLAPTWNNGSPTALSRPSMNLPGHLACSFHSDRSGLSTPEPMELSAPPPMLSPAARPLPKLRIKRRRNPSATTDLPSESSLIPSIELSETPQSSHDAFDNITTPVEEGYLTPSAASFAHSHRAFTPPMTPVAQMSMNNVDHGDWTRISRHKQGLNIRRPSSTMSEISDSSSCSSKSSLDTYQSIGESCTSPESEADPFTFGSERKAKGPLLSPLPTSSVRSKKPAKSSKSSSKWSKDMDDHLWLTYMAYLQDPLFTPFKMLPGTAPPLGVCHRVAREAKKTWKGPKLPLACLAEDLAADNRPTFRRRESSVPLQADRKINMSDPFEIPEPPMRSSSVTNFTRKVSMQWPRSSGATRRRLRQLCKRNTWLAPHYQRMMHSRSPSVSSMSSQSKLGNLSSPPAFDTNNTSAFATRDLNLNLATSTSTTMQPGNPLSRLANDDNVATPRAQQTLRPRSPPAFDRSPNRLNAHQKSQSLQIGLGLGGGTSIESRRLASPFEEHNRFYAWPNVTAGPSSSFSGNAMGPETARDEPPKLQSPLEIHAPRPLSNSMKRRAQYQLGEEMFADDSDTRMNFLQNLFGDANASGRRRVRHRGFSLGAVSQASAPPARSLADVFAPPANDQPMDTAPPQPTPADNSLMPPIQRVSRRLGSPFSPSTGGEFGHTFPRTLFPHGLDSIANLEQSQSTTQDSFSQQSQQVQQSQQLQQNQQGQQGQQGSQDQSQA